MDKDKVVQLSPDTMQAYLEKHLEKGVIDFTIRAQPRASGKGVTFYIHPEGRDGETKDFVVSGNYLWLDPAVRPVEQDPKN